jgi:hypothetical protein
MPLDHAAPRAARPFMRFTTAEIAARVPGSNTATLAEIAAELAHRERPAARKLAEEVAKLLQASAPRHEPEVAAIVIPCRNGEVLPEYREEVITVSRGPLPEMPQVPPAAPPPVKRSRSDLPEHIADTMRRACEASPAGPKGGPRRFNATMFRRAEVRWLAFSPACREWLARTGRIGLPAAGFLGDMPDCPERAAIIARERIRAEERAQAVRDLDKWGGDATAREEAARTAPTRQERETEAQHVARVAAHNERAAARAREAAKAAIAAEVATMPEPAAPAPAPAPAKPAPKVTPQIATGAAGATPLGMRRAAF